MENKNKETVNQTNKVVVESKYRKDLHRSFYLIHMFRRSLSIYFIFLLAAFVIYMAVKQTIATPTETKTIISVWVLSFATVMITPMIMFFRISSATKREAEARKDTVEILEFTKDKILRKINNESKLTLGWYNIDTIYETEEAFFIYINDDQGLVVAKDGIVKGDSELLRKLAMNNLKPNKKGKVPFKKIYKD